MIRTTQRHPRLITPTLGLFLATAVAASAQGMTVGVQEPLGIAYEDATPIMSFKAGDLALSVSHAKDAGLRRAFSMLEARLAELPREIGDEMPPEMMELFSPETIPVLLHLMKAPKSMSFGLSSTQAEKMGNPFVFGFQLDENSPEAATAFEAQLSAMFERMQAPVPPGAFAAEGSAVGMKFGMEPMTVVAPLARELVGDAPLVEEISLDVGAGLGFAEEMMQAEGAPPEAYIILGAVKRIIGDLRMEIAVTNDGKLARTAAVMTGLAASMSESGITPEGGITTAHLLPIPSDATMANVSRMDMAAAFNALNEFAKEMSAETLGDELDLASIVKESIGIDLESQLFGALGDTIGYYSSLSTGGGGLTSTVMFASVRDADALISTKEQLEDIANSLTSGMTRGYVGARTWERDEIEYTTLMFPGLPVPLEPTLAISDQWMVVAATPQAAMAAMDQIHKSQYSLASKPEVAALADGTKIGISYADTGYFARLGYGPTCVLMGAISNAVRSPLDGSRDPGPIVPIYAEFSEGIAPMLGWSEARGDDLVSMSTGDGSTVVQSAFLLGFMYEYMPAILLPVLGAVGAEDAAREMGINF